jgi:hypothetical protein
MSFISKIENSYVAILRVVIVIFATILLLGAAGLGFMALKEKFSPEAAAGIRIDTKDVLKAVVPAEEPTTAQEAAASPRKHQEDYNKAFALVAPFVQKHSNGKETLDKEAFFATLDESMQRFDTPELQKAYISGWISSMDASLKDPRILARAALVSAPAAAKPVAPAPLEASGEEELTDPDAAAAVAAEEEEQMEVAEAPTAEGIVTEISSAYSELFATKYMEELMEGGGKAKEAKTASTTYLMAAGGIFFSFLCVIFLTVTIRIERNLREMAYRSPAV